MAILRLFFGFVFFCFAFFFFGGACSLLVLSTFPEGTVLDVAGGVIFLIMAFLFENVSSNLLNKE